MTLKNLQHEAHKVRMTPEEKAAMRARIFGTQSPVTTSTASPYFFFDMQFMSRALAAVLLVVLVGGGGVAYAAEGSLPGQPLYPVKIGVTEPIKTALATSPAARAAVHVELAQRRVEEAEALAAAGKLDATTTATLEQNFEQHAQSADELALEVGATDPSAAVEIKAELASSLGVHGQLLATIASERQSDSTKANSEQLASHVIARADAAAGVSATPTASAAKVVAMAAPATPRPQAKAQAISTFAARTTSVASEPTTTETEAPAPAAATTMAASDTNTNASSSAGAQEATASHADTTSNTTTQGDTELKKRAQDALAKAQTGYTNSKSKLDSDAVASLDSQFAEVKADIDAGNYTDALKLALKLQVIIQAQTRYRTNIITPLLQLQLNINNSANENHHGWNHGDGGDQSRLGGQAEAGDH